MFLATHLRDTRRDRAILLGSLGALTLIAWTSLWLWEGSPYRAFLGHAGGVGPLPLEAILFSLGWVLMIVAMMLPSSVPLVLTFRALVGRRRGPGVLDRGIHAAVDALPWLAEHPQLIIGSSLLVAGLWQFSPIRDRCLDECRSPLGFVMNRWRGTSERRESFAMGIAHGAFCVGCCWSLMLVMFGVGVGSLVLMLALGGLTAIEKNLPSGRRLTHPAGLALVLAAVYIVGA